MLSIFKPAPHISRLPAEKIALVYRRLPRRSLSGSFWAMLPIIW